MAIQVLNCVPQTYDLLSLLKLAHIEVHYKDKIPQVGQKNLSLAY